MKKCRRFLSLALVMALLFTWLDIPVFAEVVTSGSENVNGFAGGDGSEENPYQIATAEQLNRVRDNLTANYIQIKDIDLEGYNWIPIGADAHNQFQGTYDGNNKTIYNLTIDCAPDIYYIGLFGYMSLDSSVNNLTVDSIFYSVNKENCSYQTGFLGGIAGNGNANNCVVSGKIQINNCYNFYVGGILGVGKAVDCINYADMDLVVNQGDDRHDNCGSLYCGGIVGDSWVKNEPCLRCINYGNIEAISGDSLYSGGIAGTGSTNYCVNFGNVHGETTNYVGIHSFAGNCNVGGVIGATFNNIENSINYGDVYGKSAFGASCYAGGITGYVGYQGVGQIEKCYNLGRNIDSIKQEKINGTFVDCNAGAGRVYSKSQTSKRNDCYSMDYTLIDGELAVTGTISNGCNGESIYCISDMNSLTSYIFSQLRLEQEDSFDPDIYRADFLSGDGDLSKGIRSYFDLDSPSDLFLRQLQHESGFGSTVVAWQALTKSFELIKDPTKYIDFVFEKKDIYSALILDMLESSSYNMAIIKKNACLELSESAIDYTILALKQDYNLNISKDTKFTDLTLDELNKVKEKSEDYIGKNYPEITKIDGFFEKLDGIFTVSNCLGEYYNYFINGLQVILLSDSMKSVMREMYDLCPEDNQDLKAALKDCISIMDSSAEEFFDKVAEKGMQIAGREAFKKLFGEFWEYVKLAANGQFPYLWIILAGFDYGKTVSNMYFSTDDTIEKYNNMWALYDIKQLGKETYDSMMEKHKASGELELAQGYLSANDLMFSILNQDCEKAWDFANVLDETLVNKIGQLFTGSPQNEEVKASIRGIQSDYKIQHDLSCYNWIFSLEEDFPLTGTKLFEKYYYLANASKEKIKKEINVACPVDVYVYDGESNLVASVVDNQPWCESDDLTVAVEEDEKTLYFYDGANYTVRCVGTDTGDMDITIKEFDEEEKEIRSVCYYDIPLTTDKAYHIVADDKQLEEAEYTLTDETTEQVIDIDSDSLKQETTGAPTYKVQIKSGTVKTEKDIGFEAQLFEKQQAEISAYIPVGYEFVRWEVSNPEVYLEDEYSSVTSFRMPASDVIITAITKPSEILSPDQTVTISSNHQYISNIQPGTTVQELVSHLAPSGLVVKDSKGNEMNESDTVGTGCTVSLPDGSSKLTVVLFGDVTGDGLINVMDLSKMQNHVLGLQTLEGCQKIAASFGKEVIDINAILKENASILNLQKIDQSYQIS